MGAILRITFLMFAVELCCCATRPKEFDYLSQSKVNDLIARSQVVFAEVARGELSKSESQAFLDESIGTVSALYAGEKWDRNEKAKLQSLASLKAHLETLSARSTTLRVSDAAPLGVLLSDVKNRYRILRRYNLTFESGTSPDDTMFGRNVSEAIDNSRKK